MVGRAPPYNGSMNEDRGERGLEAPCSRLLPDRKGTAVADVVLVLLIVGFFGLCTAYVRALDRMVGSTDDPDREEATTG